MLNGNLNIPTPQNEPVLAYAPGSKEKAALKDMLKHLSAEKIDIPMVIGGKEVKTGKLGQCVMPHNHSHVLATYHKGNREHVQMAIDAALKARKEWAETPWESRAAIFLKMAELLKGKYRMILNAATMLGQSKTCYQAEIDSACELIDFFKFNASFMQELYREQPISSDGVWNSVEYRPLEGFVFAITPFNFTSIAGNLPTAPALMGNVVVWKPASTSVYSAHWLMQLFKEAGLPDGVINLVLGSGGEVGDPIVESPHLAGIHFTGSTSVFHGIWKKIGGNIERYKTYPRIVGETGGKDFIFAHPTADVDELVTAMIRGSFEYQGQKCSAASRAYVPKSIWGEVLEKMSKEVATIKVGDITDFKNFMGAVIDKSSFDNLKGAIDYAKDAGDAEVVIGGEYDESRGYFISPTVILTTNPHFRTMEEELFGPVLTVYAYEDNDLEKALELCDTTSAYALTGGVFARDRHAIIKMSTALKNAAGNFYINDKPTGAVVGQQPFGGSRASGTNDKAGSKANLMRWVSVRTIKETFCPPKNYRYSFLDEK